MADKPPAEKDDFLFWFIGIMILLFGVWIYRGGPERELAHEGAFIRPYAPNEDWQGYGGSYLYVDDNGDSQIELPPPIININKIEEGVSDFGDKVKEVEFVHRAPISSRSIIIDGFSGAEATNPQGEYIRVVANSRNRFDIPLTGLILESSISGEGASIPEGAPLPIPGEIPGLQAIRLSPTERAIITSGRSPIGASFKTNICSGYLGQFQTYVPELRRECPRPEDELELAGIDDRACRNFVEDIPRCEIFRGTVPLELSDACKRFIAEKLNYASCVATHEDDVNFYRDEWRIFLGRNAELWRADQEIIKIVDQNGNTIDAVTY